MSSYSVPHVLSTTGYRLLVSFDTLKQLCTTLMYLRTWPTSKWSAKSKRKKQTIGPRSSGAICRCPMQGLCSFPCGERFGSSCVHNICFWISESYIAITSFMLPERVTEVCFKDGRAIQKMNTSNTQSLVKLDRSIPLIIQNWALKYVFSAWRWPWDHFHYQKFCSRALTWPNI